MPPPIITETNMATRSIRQQKFHVFRYTDEFHNFQRRLLQQRVRPQAD